MVKEPKNVAFLRLFSTAKTKKCHQKTWSAFDEFGVNILCPAAYFLEVGACAWLKIANKDSFIGIKLLKFRFSGYFSKAKTEECHQKNWRFCDKVGMLMLAPNTYFLEVSARLSLKVVTKASFRGKEVLKFSIFKVFFLKQKRRSATKNNEVPLMNLTLLYLVQLHIFWKLVQVFDWKSNWRFF